MRVSGDEGVEMGIDSWHDGDPPMTNWDIAALMMFIILAIPMLLVVRLKRHIAKKKN